MKVSICENNKCACYERRRWSHRHVGCNGRAVGMTHAFGYCRLEKKPCADIKRCLLFGNKVKPAHWTPDKYDPEYKFECSECGYTAEHPHNHCPGCGSRMLNAETV